MKAIVDAANGSTCPYCGGDWPWYLAVCKDCGRGGKPEYDD